MVKRQTVWLSTMMVLSLMLIGYYTVNNGAGSGTSTMGNDSGSITTAGQPTDNGASKSGSGSSDSASSTNGKSGTTATATDDWFAKSRTTQQQKLSQQDAMYKEIIGSDKSSNAQVVQAQQDENQLTAIQGAMAQARDAVLAEGYPDCVIFPTIDTKTGSLTKVQVYVKADKLSTDKAIQIMNVVSQNMSISINNIVVYEHK